MLIYGTTVYIGSVPVDTLYGDFTINVYQDLIHKGYILALCHGEINSDVLTTRIHSSCITSETLGSMDCDCVAQLNGAIEAISKTNGILFYLIQEGRGCGYVGKSRACMAVQESEQRGDETPKTTFEAYKELGMCHDYRNYSNIGDICHMLDIKPEWVLLSNNPDKIKGLLAAGQTIKEVASIEIPPNPFNYSYLWSKMQTGHILHQVKTKHHPKHNIPKEVKNFEPKTLATSQRFIYCSSYFLPLKAIQDHVLVEESQLVPGMELVNNESYGNRKLVEIVDKSLYEKFPDLLTQPYWFQVHVYFDIISHMDFVVLEYSVDKRQVPAIRIHSESLLNRFPLTEPRYRNKFKNSILRIVQNRHGYIFLMHRDGKGLGLGNLCLNMAYKNAGEEDSRDYDPIFVLLREHIGDRKIDILHSGQSLDRLKAALDSKEIPVREWVNIEE
jgi:3,4-dihydroxy 2-butanone 4-phosphate synthase/GTP cyclohydrolase II